MNWRILVVLAGAAAGLMYLFDPDAGARRRAQMREQWTELTRRAGATLGVATETAPARVGETLEPALRLFSALGGALFTVWGLRRLDEVIDALGELVQG
jgi:hypothetical protein